MSATVSILTSLVFAAHVSVLAPPTDYIYADPSSTHTTTSDGVATTNDTTTRATLAHTTLISPDASPSQGGLMAGGTLLVLGTMFAGSYAWVKRSYR